MDVGLHRLWNMNIHSFGLAYSKVFFSSESDIHEGSLISTTMYTYIKLLHVWKTVNICGVPGWLCCRVFVCCHQLSSDRELILVVLIDCSLLVKFVICAG